MMFYYFKPVKDVLILFSPERIKVVLKLNIGWHVYTITLGNSMHKNYPLDGTKMTKGVVTRLIFNTELYNLLLFRVLHESWFCLLSEMLKDGTMLTHDKV